MKRGMAMLLAMAMALMLAACGGNGAPAGNTAGNGTAADDGGDHVHTEEILPAVEPTCTETGLTEGRRCAECGEILVEQETIPALGHTTETGTCERCGQTFGIWTTGFYVDEFQQPVEGQWFIWNENPVWGTFSNSATTNSELAVRLAYDYHNWISFFLFEYGSSQVKNVWDTDTYSITMRTPDGVDHEMKGYLYESADRIILDEAYTADVITALSGEGEVSFYLKSGRFETTSYLFSIEASNFAEEYSTVTSTADGETQAA